jgi:type I restriction enzyme, S subunit
VSFAELTIGELEAQGCFLAIQDGNHGEKHPKANDYVPEGVPFIMASDIRAGRVDIEGANKLPQSITDKLRIGFCRGGDVLLSHKGSVGYVAIAPEHSPYLMLTPQVTYYRVNPEKLSAEFLGYAFREPMFQKRLLSTAGQQGTRGYVGITAQRQLKVRFCDRTIQDRVVDAMRPYDDLIENNRRRIALLEQAAQMLYREWFIHFRFPAHEHVKIIDGLPEGWERRTLGSVLNLQRGFDLPVGARSPGGIPVYGSTGIVGEHDRAKVSTPTLITGRSGSLGSVCFVNDPCWPLNTSLWVTEFKAVSVYFAYFMLAEMNLAKFNGGASVPTLDRKVAHAASVVIPTPLLASLFDEQAQVLFAQMKLLERQNTKLAQARDLLLPRLMKGEIAV